MNTQPVIKIVTQNGTNYTIDLDGCFLQYNQHSWQHPHNSWKCSGVAMRKAFNHFDYFDLADFALMIKSGEITTFNNGSAKFYIRDIDNGTNRLQMDGIAKAYLC